MMGVVPSTVAVPAAKALIKCKCIAVKARALGLECPAPWSSLSSVFCLALPCLALLNARPVLGERPSLDLLERPSCLVVKNTAEL
jgi:hypothetical protein